MVFIWVAAVVLFAIVEAATEGLVSIWFVLGALAALGATALGASPAGQLVVFAIASAAALILTRPLVKRWGRKDPALPTNLDRVIGMTGRVTREIDNGTFSGEVYVEGKAWSACSEDGSSIPEGTQVVISRIEGVRLYVTPVVEKKEEDTV